MADWWHRWDSSHLTLKPETQRKTRLARSKWLNHTQIQTGFFSQYQILPFKSEHSLDSLVHCVLPMTGCGPQSLTSEPRPRAVRGGGGTWYDSENDTYRWREQMSQGASNMGNREAKLNPGEQEQNQRYRCEVTVSYARRQKCQDRRRLRTCSSWLKLKRDDWPPPHGMLGWTGS